MEKTTVPTVKEARTIQHLASVRIEHERINQHVQAVQKADDDCARQIMSRLHDGKTDASCKQLVSSNFLSKIKDKGYEVSQWTRDEFISDDHTIKVSGPLVKWN
ncbi:MAG: hypothetical protein WD512_18335 [Candidatus Paceibacterota bacterium]